MKKNRNEERKKEIKKRRKKERNKEKKKRKSEIRWIESTWRMYLKLQIIIELH